MDRQILSFIYITNLGKSSPVAFESNKNTFHNIYNVRIYDLLYP